MFDACDIEAERLVAQRRLDLARPQPERNRLGQFATPTSLANDILQYARAHFGTKPVRFLDPAIGTGAFYGALLRHWPAARIEQATGFEIDPYYAGPCRELWAQSSLQLRMEDFTAAAAPRLQAQRYNLVICNPPYVRHHHLSVVRKRRLQARSFQTSGARLSGLAGLYVHFLALAQPWMSAGALAGWLVPSEFMDVNYGDALKGYLTSRVTLLRIHRFEPTDVQFDDALVSSALVWIRNLAPSSEHRVELTLGGSLTHPKRQRLVPLSELQGMRKWRSYPQPRRAAGVARSSTLGDLFRIQRGIATGANDFFIMTPEQAAARGIPAAYLRPILPRPRDLEANEVMADDNGHPLLARKRLLLDCSEVQEFLRERHPALWRYLQAGVGQVSGGYLCSRRSPWYSQEARQPTPFLCSYIARPGQGGRLQRFIFNRSVAIASNSYLMLYPREELARFIDGDASRARAVWRQLCRIRPGSLRSAGRVYGGGMYKVEPRELASVSAAGILSMLGR